MLPFDAPADSQEVQIAHQCIPLPTMPSSSTPIAQDQRDRPRYSDVELHDYFTSIKLPRKYLNSSLLSNPANATTKQHGLPFLQALTRHHMCNIPFDNLVLSYSAHKTVSLNVTDLYAKFVRRRRGGRCMENNTFFGTVLRSLGYEVRNCGGRVSRAMSPFPEVRQSQAATYDGWNHMLNLVLLDGEWYIVDVGMGAMGPNLPYPLRDGFEMTSVAPRKIRLQLRPIAESYATHSPKPSLWCYDVCYNPVTDPTQNAWVPVYCFTETEFLPQDYEVMSWFTSTNDRSFFTRYVLCTKMLMDELEETIVGNVTLFNNLIRKSIGTNRSIVRECKSENERVQALAEFFGIELSDEERNGIPSDRMLR